MARKIVFRSKSNMPLLVFLLMIIAQAGNSGLSRFFIEETERQNAPHSFDPLHRRTGALIRNHHNIKAHVLKMDVASRHFVAIGRMLLLAASMSPFSLGVAFSTRKNLAKLRPHFRSLEG